MITQTQATIMLGLIVATAAVIIGVPAFVSIKSMDVKEQRLLMYEKCIKTELRYSTKYGMRHVYDCTGVDIK